MIHSGEDVVDDVLQHHRGHAALLAAKQGGVAGDVLADPPEHAGLGRLGGAGPEQLGAVEPRGGDPVVLLAGARDGEVEHDAGPWGGAPRRRRVRGGRGRAAVGIAEVVAEEGEGARGRPLREEEVGSCGVQELLWLCSARGPRGETVALGGTWGGGDAGREVGAQGGYEYEWQKERGGFASTHHVMSSIESNWRWNEVYVLGGGHIYSEMVAIGALRGRERD